MARARDPGPFGELSRELADLSSVIRAQLEASRAEGTATREQAQASQALAGAVRAASCAGGAA
jgi:hypothetical protein